MFDCSKSLLFGGPSVVFGFDEKTYLSNRSVERNPSNNAYIIDRYSDDAIDHELMYAMCIVLTDEGIAGYGAPFLQYEKTIFYPEIMLCHPQDTVTPFTE